MRIQHTNVPLLLVLLTLLTATSAQAQALAGDFNELRLKVKPGDTIYITATDGEERRGRVLDLTRSTLLVEYGDQRRELTETDVRRIRQRLPDPLWTGAVIGAGVGVALGALSASFSEECSHNTSSGGCIGPVLMMTGISAGVGIGIDALIQGRKPIYERRPSTVTVAPYALPGRAGVRVTLALR